MLANIPLQEEEEEMKYDKSLMHSSSSDMEGINQEEVKVSDI